MSKSQITPPHFSGTCNCYVSSIAALSRKCEAMLTDYQIQNGAARLTYVTGKLTNASSLSLQYLKKKIKIKIMHRYLHITKNTQIIKPIRLVDTKSQGEHTIYTVLWCIYKSK